MFLKTWWHAHTIFSGTQGFKERFMFSLQFFSSGGCICLILDFEPFAKLMRGELTGFTVPYFFWIRSRNYNQHGATVTYTLSHCIPLPLYPIPCTHCTYAVLSILGLPQNPLLFHAPHGYCRSLQPPWVAIPRQRRKLSKARGPQRGSSSATSIFSKLSGDGPPLQTSKWCRTSDVP